MKARILVAEDEPLMAERLVAQLGELWPEARVVAVAGNGDDAWEAYVEHEPDVVFLDIRMPGRSGLDLAARIGATAADGPAAPARIVFVTAYDAHALEAFERGAIDYLLKPVEATRLATTLKRLEAAAPPAPAGLVEVLRQLRTAAPPPAYSQWIKASQGKRIRLIPVADVRFFQADAKYTRVAAADGDAWIRTPLRELLGRLDPARFWQIHRSAVVNVDAVAGAERVDADRLEVVVKGSGERLPVSRAFFHLFKEE